MIAGMRACALTFADRSPTRAIRASVLSHGPIVASASS